MNSTEKTDAQQERERESLQKLAVVAAQIQECSSLEGLKELESNAEEFIKSIGDVDARYREMAIRNIYHGIGVLRGCLLTVEELQSRTGEEGEVQMELEL